MRWTVHGERALYTSPWVNLHLADIEVPEGPRFDHHLIRMPFPAVGTIVHRPDAGVLLLWRHRFITDTWGWEIPAGRVEAGEALDEAARREVIEETGWAPGPLQQLFGYHYALGLSDGRFVIFLSRKADQVGPPTDVAEAERIEWVPAPDVRRLVGEGRVTDGLTLTALLWAFSFGLLEP